jgi:hypothetical protein
MIACGIRARNCKSFFKPRTRFRRMVVKGSKSATVHNHSRFIDDVDALWPGAVCQIRRLLHVIHADRQGEVESLDKIVGDGYALGEGVRLRIANAFVHIAFHLPFVLRMRFANVDGQKVRLSFVIVVKTYEVTYLAPERRSGVTSENENERAPADAIAKMKCSLPI